MLKVIARFAEALAVVSREKDHAVSRTLFAKRAHELPEPVIRVGNFLRVSGRVLKVSCVKPAGLVKTLELEVNIS